MSTNLDPLVDLNRVTGGQVLVWDAQSQTFIGGDYLNPATQYANPSWLRSLSANKIVGLVGLIQSNSSTTTTTSTSAGIVPISRGGTGATTAASARSALGAQAYNLKLTTFSALANAAGVLTNDGSGNYSWGVGGGGGDVYLGSANVFTENNTFENILFGANDTYTIGVTGTRPNKIWVGTGGIETSGAITATSYSGSLVSSVTGTTQSANDNSTKIATTAYADAAVAALDGVNIAYKDEANVFTNNQRINATDENVLHLVNTIDTPDLTYTAFRFEVDDNVGFGLGSESVTILGIYDGSSDWFRITQDRYLLISGTDPANNYSMGPAQFIIGAATTASLSFQVGTGEAGRVTSNEHLHLNCGSGKNIHLDVNAVHILNVATTGLSPENDNSFALGDATHAYSNLYAYGIQLGHATDTTITRASAGVIAVEGSNVLLASNIGTTVGDVFLAGNQTFTGANTFSRNGAVSSASLVITGNPYTAGSATTNHPLAYFNGGTAPTTWSATGTYLGINAVSGFTGSLIDFHINGGSSVFSVTYTGNIASTGNLWLNSASTMIQFGTGQDVLIGRATAANLRLGSTDAASPVAQTLSVQNVLAGTSNTAGADWTISGSVGTGTGAGGKIIFRGAYNSTTGSTQNALTDFLTIDPVNNSIVMTGKHTAAGSWAFRVGNNGSSAAVCLMAENAAISNPRVALTASGVVVNNSGHFAWASTSLSANTATSPDLILLRDAAGVLSVRNSTTAQGFRVYNTYTDASNYEYAQFSWSSNILNITTVNAGTGTVRGIIIGAGSTSTLSLDNGSALATFNGAITLAAASSLTHSGRSSIRSSASGQHNMINSAGSGYTSLTLGPESANFTRFKINSGVGVDIRNGDDTAYYNVRANNFVALPSNDTVALSVSGSSVTGSGTTALINLAQTWNTSGNVTGILANFTNTASGASSLVMDLQVSSASVFSVSRGGAVTATSFPSPALTGNPTAPTQSPGDNSTRIATTAYADAAVAASISDTGFTSTWDGITTIGPSKNAVYDAIKTHAIPFGSFGAASDGTVYLTTYAIYACTIDSIQNVETTSGTISLAVQINGVSVTGLSAVAITSTTQDVNASAANTVAVGDEITLVFSSASSAVDVRGTLILTRT